MWLYATTPCLRILLNTGLQGNHYSFIRALQTDEHTCWFLNVSTALLPLLQLGQLLLLSGTCQTSSSKAGSQSTWGQLFSSGFSCPCLAENLVWRLLPKGEARSLQTWLHMRIQEGTYLKYEYKPPNLLQSESDSGSET